MMEEFEGHHVLTSELYHYQKLTSQKECRSTGYKP